MRKEIIVMVFVGMLALTVFASFDQTYVIASSENGENGVNETGNQTNGDLDETVYQNNTTNNGNQTDDNVNETGSNQNNTQNNSEDETEEEPADDSNSGSNNKSKGRPWSDVSEEVWNKGIGKGLDKAFNKSHGRWADDEIEEKKNEWKKKFENITNEEIQEKFNNSGRAFGHFKQQLKFFGGLSYEKGYTSGDLIHFMFDEEKGTILSYTLMRNNSNVTVFDLVEITPFTPKDDPVAHGAVWRCNAEKVRLEAHDNPTALLKVKSFENKTVAFYLSDNITVSTTNSSNILSVSGDIDGKLVVTGPIAGNNTTGSMITIGSDMVNVTLYENSHVFFLATPVEGIGVGISEENENKIQNAIANGKVGARVFAQKKNQTHDETYSDMETTTDVKEGKVEIIVNSTEKTGKTIVVDIDFETMNVTDPSDVVVMFDGEEISMADDYDDILNSSDDGNNSEYLIVFGSNGVQVLVSIPSFSEHTITISQASSVIDKDDDKTTAYDSTVVLLVFAVIIIAIIAYAVYNRKK
jgi:hypothetical protein